MGRHPVQHVGGSGGSAGPQHDGGDEVDVAGQGDGPSGTEYESNMNLVCRSERIRRPR